MGNEINNEINRPPLPFFVTAAFILGFIIGFLGGSSIANMVIKSAAKDAKVGHYILDENDQKVWRWLTPKDSESK